MRYLNNRHKLKAGDKWGAPVLYRNKDNVPWEPINPEWVGRTVASFENKINFIREVPEGSHEQK